MLLLSATHSYLVSCRPSDSRYQTTLRRDLLLAVGQVVSCWLAWEQVLFVVDVTFIYNS